MRTQGEKPGLTVKTGTGQPKEIISVGNAEIDKKMGGGIPVGSLTLVEGQSDSGKSVLTQQMIFGALNDGAKTTLYTNENTLKSLIKQMASLNQNILDYVLLGKCKVFTMNTTSKGLDASQALKILSKSIGKDKDTDLIVIDSFTFFMTHCTSDEIIVFFEDCKGYCDQGITIINTVHSYAFTEADLARIRSMCDAHLSLRIEQVGEQLIKMIEVGKVKGANKTTGNIISFDVEPGLGMRIIPISKAKA